MKILNNVVQYILIIALALAIFSLVLMNIFSSSILDKEYILSKFDEYNYYEKMYENVVSNFENYIQQSGLDEEVLNNIVTKEKVKEDTKIILSNIYEGKNEKINTDDIKEALNKNIDTSLNRVTSENEKVAISEFVVQICEEYESTIFHTNYEQKINSIYKDVMKVMALSERVIIVTIIVSSILLLLLTIKQIYKVVARFGVAGIISGIILKFINSYINSKVKINAITLLNDSISNILRDVLNEILDSISRYGNILLISGIILVIVYAVIEGICKAKKESAKYKIEE